MAVLYEWGYSLDETLGLLESNTPGEDIWKKFEDLPDFDNDCDLDGIYELENLTGDFTPFLCGSNEIRRHDCMWAGTCVSEDHRRTLQSACKSAPGPSISPIVCPLVPSATTSPALPAATTTIPVPPQAAPAPVRTPSSPESSPVKSTPEPKPQVKRTGVIVQKTVGRSILLSSRTNTPSAAANSSWTVRTEVSRPETPQSLSESEEEEAKRDDEPDYRGVAVSEVTGQVRRTTTVPAPPAAPVAATTTPANVQFDHNYDVKAGNVRTDDLGIQTPSDSDEEIDVVSLVSSRNQTTLPTNPSRAMRYELQQTVEHAITNNKLLSASRAVSRRLKASGPGRKPKRKRVSSDDEEEFSFATRVPKSAGGNKRGHQHYYHQRRSPKKSRHSTDSETDTSERRSLHNNMERMRRIDLRNAFDDLRILLPSLEGKHRAPKVTILKDATLFLHELTLQDRTFQSQVAALRKEQEKLRTNLSHLRRSLAAKR